MRFKIMGIVPGSYSGVRKNLFDVLEKKHEIVEIFDSSLSRTERRYSHFMSYFRTAIALHDLPSHPTQWQQLTNKNIWRWLKATQLSEKEIRHQIENIDFVLQVGSNQGLFKKKPLMPYVIYTDGTRAITERGDPLCRLWPSEKEKYYRTKLEKELYHNASAILTFSEFVRKSVIDDYGIDENKVATVYAGPNVNEIPSYIEKDYSSKTILFVGRDFYRKGGPSLIKAFGKIKKEIKDAKLILVGSEPKADTPGRINTLLDFFGLKVNTQKIPMQDIKVTGYVTSEELVNLYRESSIFAMPSIQENFGHVFLEAMAYKTPCIGSIVDAIPEIIEEGKNGFLVEPNNPKQLAEKLILLLQDENLMKEMGDSGRRRVKKYFTWDLVVDRMTRQFKKIN